MSIPSTVIVPLSGFRKEAANPAMVVLPEPDVPTSAVTDPTGAEKVIFFSTGFPSS
jgi:hypothetical protein